MTAKQDLENLSHSWYGYVVCAALFSVFGLRASGIFTFAIGLSIWMVINAFMLVVALAVVTFLSRRLLARSSGTRVFLIVVSALFAVLGTLTFLDEGRMFLSYWSLSLLLRMAATAVGVMMNARSFAILMRPNVRRYFA
jgi:hypothetical protein